MPQEERKGGREEGRGIGICLCSHRVFLTVGACERCGCGPPTIEVAAESAACHAQRPESSQPDSPTTLSSTVKTDSIFGPQLL